ncbi:MAG TPA: Gfo/Idh/MocA family oxidoreductase [Oligoflexia bacterium]|nr:Gfo/Idh/MocA family oxidoreductase [Oligoflexia bacterium]
MNIGIIGAGLIGNKRANALPSTCKLTAVADLSNDRAHKLATAFGARAESSWAKLVSASDVDCVIVATTNDVIPDCAKAALKAGKHVLIEKPGGRFPDEVRSIADVAACSRGILRVGFNHRFHPGLQGAKKLLDSGVDGPLMYIRARYGHGARVGYEKEWRGNPKLGGGGELLDQGVHLIDLCRWVGGSFELQYGHAQTFFWDMPVEDNGFLILRSPDRKRSAFLHASCTEWKNLFDFEIFAKNAKIQIFGLGGSYGTEELRYYKMKPEMGPPDITVTPFPGADESWKLEFQAFLSEVDGRKTDIGRIEDAVRAIEIVFDVYRSSGYDMERAICNA